MKILLIEDDPIIRMNVSDMLETENYEVNVAENGRQGVELALETLPDLIICDIMMPEMDGYAVMERIRAHPETQNTPVIFLSAMADRSQIRHGMNLGADDYLTKPFKREELLYAIVARLERRAALERQAQQQVDLIRAHVSLALPKEIHAPLTSLLGTQQLLIELYDSYTRGQVVSMVEQMHKDTRKLHRLMHNFLLYARLELMAHDGETLAGLRDTYTTPAALMAAVADEKTQEYERDSDLLLEVENGNVAASETVIRLITSELLDNAFKFSMRGCRVTLEGRSEYGHYLIRVTDNGPGIDPEILEQGPNAPALESKIAQDAGAGFGLALVQRLASLCGGELDIQNWSGPNNSNGTKVTVQLPLQAM